MVTLWQWVTDGWPCWALTGSGCRLVRHTDERWHLYHRGTLGTTRVGDYGTLADARAAALAMAVLDHQAVAHG